MTSSYSISRQPPLLYHIRDHQRHWWSLITCLLLSYRNDTLQSGQLWCQIQYLCPLCSPLPTAGRNIEWQSLFWSCGMKKWPVIGLPYWYHSSSTKEHYNLTATQSRSNNTPEGISLVMWNQLTSDWNQLKAWMTCVGVSLVHQISSGVVMGKGEYTHNAHNTYYTTHNTHTPQLTLIMQPGSSALLPHRLNISIISSFYQLNIMVEVILYKLWNMIQQICFQTPASLL